MVRFHFFFLSILLLLGLNGSAPAAAADRVALVIGNGAYQKVPTLPNPTRDAADISKALERLNFRVTQISNASAADMRKAIVDFGRTTEGSQMAVVFYAGHGMEAGGENWLIPVDAELRSDADVESEAVSLRSINLQVSKARQLGLVILDACRNNPFAAKMKRSLSTRAVSRGLAPTEPTDNVLVAYAARDGTTANDGDGLNSPFTAALLRNIETPGLEISFLFRRVRDDVMSATKREQQPFVYGSLSKEEIYLKPPAASASPIANVSTPPVINQTRVAPAEDEQFWEAIRTSTVSGLYEEFLSRYPRSNHVVEARGRINDLRSEQIATASPSAVSPSDNDAKIANEGMSPGPKSPERRPFTSEVSRRVESVGARLQFRMPPFTIGATWDSPLAYAGFIGVWSSERGWGYGKGRHAMLIITGVSADGLVRGHYLWGPPTKASWEKSPAGYTQFFTEKIVENAFSFKSGDQTINAKFDRRNSITLSTRKPEKPSETASVELSPIWRPSVPETAELSVDRERASRKSKETSVINPFPTRIREPKPRADQEPRMAAEDSRCNRMHDKLGCLCALQNGGGISTDGRTWYSKRTTQTATNEAFVQCQIRAGRR